MSLAEAGCPLERTIRDAIHLPYLKEGAFETFPDLLAGSKSRRHDQVVFVGEDDYLFKVGLQIKKMA